MLQQEENLLLLTEALTAIFAVALKLADTSAKSCLCRKAISPADSVLSSTQAISNLSPLFPPGSDQIEIKLTVSSHVF